MDKLFSSIRRKRPQSYEESQGKGGKAGKEEKDEDEDEEEEEEEQEWAQIRDPYGRPCWQHKKTGQVTYGNSYAIPQQGFNPVLAQQAFSDSPPDSPAKKTVTAAATAGGVSYALSPVPYGHSPVPYGMSPVSYGVSPVAMYPTAPWNMGVVPVSPVPYQAPEYVKKQYAEAEKAKKKKKEAAEKKKEKEAAGVWERFYDGDGVRYWQHSVTGKKMDRDPYY